MKKIIKVANYKAAKEQATNKAAKEQTAELEPEYDWDPDDPKEQWRFDDFVAKDIEDYKREMKRRGFKV